MSMDSSVSLCSSSLPSLNPMRDCIFGFFDGVSDPSKFKGLFCPATEPLESLRRADLTDWQLFL